MNQTNRKSSAAIVAGVVVGFLAGVVVTAAITWMSASSEPTADAGAEAEAEQGGSPPATVRVDQVKMQTLRRRIAVIGRLEEVRRVTVTSEVEGKVVDLAVDEGDRVAGGETVLARIDDVWAKLALESAKAEVAEAEAQLTQSVNDLEQLERLLKAGSAKTKEVEDQRTTVATNRARLAAAKATKQRRETEVERVVVTAPFDGAVSHTMVEVGQWVEPGEGLIEMISAGSIDAAVDVPERYVNELKIGDEVEVVVDAIGQSVMGKIVSIRPDGMNASRTFPVKIRVPDEDGHLRAGMSVVVHLPISDRKEFITVPRDAVLMSATGAAVWYAMQGDGPMPMALSEPVNVLFGVDDRYVVEPLPGGQFPALNEGTQVVIEGAERLYPTVLLDILPEGSPDQQAAPGVEQDAPPSEGQDETTAAAGS